MLRSVIRGWAWLALGAMATSSVCAVAGPCSTGAGAELRRIALGAGARLALDLPASTAAHLLEEQGIDLTLSVDGAASAELSIRPPRMGITVIPAAARRIELQARAGQGVGEAWLWLHCLDGTQVRQIGQLETFYRSRLEQGAAAAAAALPELRTALAAAGDDWSRAWWSHAQAQALHLAGNYQDAHAAFDHAHQAWLLTGDRARAGVALMAGGESASRAGDYPRADRMADGAIELLDQGPEFFLLRSQASKCVSRGRRGDLRAAITCEAAVARRYREIGERAEAGVRDVSIGNQWLVLGDIEAAARHLELAQRDWDSLTPTARGRLLLALGTLALQKAELGLAIARYRDASGAFAALANGWDQAIVDLKLARFARLSGAAAEEHALLERVVAAVNERDMPELLATAWLRQSQLAIDDGRHAQARAAAERGEALCARIGKGDCLERAQLQAAEVALAQGDAAAAQAALDRLVSPGQAYAGAYRRVLGARLALARGDARSVLRDLPSGLIDSLPMDLAAKAIGLRSGAHQWLGEPGAAREFLLAQAQRAAAMARALPGSALQASVRRYLGEIQSSQVDLLDTPLNAPIDVALLQQLLQMIEWTALPAAASERAAGLLDDTQRAQLSSAVLEDRALSTRELLLAYAQGRPASAQGVAPPPSLAVGGEELVLLALAGHLQWVLIVHDGRDARVCLREPRARLDAASAVFERALDGEDGAISEGWTQARAWLDVVHQCHPSHSGAKHWRVVSSAAMPGVPWPWIAAVAGDQEPTLSQGFGVVARRTAAAPYARARLLNLDLAGRDRLPFAVAEGARVERTLRSAGMDVDIDAPGARSAREVLQALATPAAIVHVIGHGNDPVRGPLYVGLWFRAQPASQLLTWPELASAPSRAALVVLSACGAGPREAGANQINLTLAEALLAAGAREVVAASNRLSDAAAPIWTERFYQELMRVQDAALALKRARQYLRQSPHFRHPKFWAGLAHYQP